MHISDIDECASSPCGQDGICLDLVNHYRCFCPLWKGPSPTCHQGTPQLFIISFCCYPHFKWCHFYNLLLCTKWTFCFMHINRLVNHKLVSVRLSVSAVTLQSAMFRPLRLDISSLTFHQRDIISLQVCKPVVCAQHCRATAYCFAFQLQLREDGCQCLLITCANIYRISPDDVSSVVYLRQDC